MCEANLRELLGPFKGIYGPLGHFEGMKGPKGITPLQPSNSEASLQVGRFHALSKGTQISEPSSFSPLRRRYKGKGAIFSGDSLQNGHFPCISWENRMSQGVDNRGSLISAALASGLGALRPGSSVKSNRLSKATV